VSPNDPTIDGQDITFDNGGVQIMAYQARLKTISAAVPVVLVCHENRGLTDHIRDVARRFAREGYVACAVDLLSREGGTASKNPAQIPGLLSGAPVSRHVSDFQAAVAHYKTQNFVRSELMGMTGYCFGGGITWQAAEQIPDLKSASPYYGPRPPLDQVPNIKAAVFAVYSSDPGDFANNGRDELEAALRTANITYEIKVYPNTRHAFHNDTGSSWSPDQGPAAFKDTLAWFERYLRS